MPHHFVRSAVAEYYMRTIANGQERVRSVDGIVRLSGTVLSSIP